jgi:hypothetical protein
MKPTPISAFLCFLAVGVVLAVVPRFASQDATGSIEGTVIEAGSTKPVAGAQIFLAGGANPGLTSAEAQARLNERAANGVFVPDELLQVAREGGPNFYDGRGGARGLRPIVVADAEGRFVIPNLTPGPYAVRAEREGYFGAIRDGVAFRYVTASITVAPQQRQSV